MRDKRIEAWASKRGSGSNSTIVLSLKPTRTEKNKLFPAKLSTRTTVHCTKEKLYSPKYYKIFRITFHPNVPTRISERRGGRRRTKSPGTTHHRVNHIISNWHATRATLALFSSWSHAATDSRSPIIKIAQRKINWNIASLLMHIVCVIIGDQSRHFIHVTKQMNVILRNIYDANDVHRK